MTFTTESWVQNFVHAERAQTVALLERLFEEQNASGNGFDTTTLSALQVQLLLKDASGIVANPSNP